MDMANIDTYIQMLLQSLANKKDVMMEIEEKTKEQEAVLSVKEPDVECLERLLDEKEATIQKLEDLDEGFERVFHRIKEDLEEKKMDYRTYIEKMQKLIKEIADVSVRIQALEHKNRDKMETFLLTGRASIKSYKLSSVTASQYYKNMANQHQTGQSYFLNKKS